MPKRNKRITRILTIQVSIRGRDGFRIVAPLEKKNYDLIVYFLRGMKVKIQKIKEISQVLPMDEKELADKEFEERMKDPKKESDFI